MGEYENPVRIEMKISQKIVSLEQDEAL
ncbi:MAG: hypothetical protein PWR01_2866, partial [Clostridiales bacterium]|nr:hypothetical protein [Clostridiales bacterium]MDN5281793.1 hypothetical protein [Candidatus Ozemobacter sp.]